MSRRRIPLLLASILLLSCRSVGGFAPRQQSTSTRRAPLATECDHPAHRRNDDALRHRQSQQQQQAQPPIPHALRLRTVSASGKFSRFLETSDQEGGEKKEEKASAGAQSPARGEVKDEGEAVEEEEEEEEEGSSSYPTDPASTTPQLLAALWSLIAEGTGMVRGESSTLLFPNMEGTLTPSYLTRLLGHFDVCKDVCDDFGVNTVLVPYTADNEKNNNKVVGFTVKSYRNPDVEGDDDGYNFDPDPFWDDDEDWSGIALGLDDDEDDEGDKGKDEPYPEIVNRVPDDDDEIIEVTRRWVDKMMSDMGICPFTSGPDLSGMPMGKVLYEVDRSSKIEDVYAAYWKMVCRVESANEKELSTPLQIFPEFCMDNVEMFENFSNTLTQPLESLNVEDLLQLVFFHPEWTFRDGGERSGVGAAANYARRSPWPMINILRTNQVRAAQRGIPTGLVYQQNEKTLNSVGTRTLETMLRKRDWSDVADLKVNRRDMEALRIAQDYKETGEIAEEDRNVVHDSTPAANKVDRSQIEGGDMVNVILQAIEKRLTGGDDGGVQRLSGAETSAAMMASDFLLEHLDHVVPVPASAAAAAGGSPYASMFETDDVPPIMGDGGGGAEDEEMSVLFGGKGIMDK